jgi:hypothetical protein
MCPALSLRGPLLTGKRYDWAKLASVTTMTTKAPT